MTIAELTDLFARLGARNPAGWACSQLTEGIPQLARFLFLRQAWRRVVSDSTWIQTMEDAQLSEPGGAIAPALRRVLSLGVNPRDLTTIVRAMQWRMLSELCYLLDDPGDVEDEVKHIAWRLFQIDAEGKPIAAVSGLHESVLDVEPSGKELRSA